MSIRLHRHERELAQHGDRHEQRSPHADRHAGEDRARHHPVRAGLQKLRQAIDDREVRDVLRDFARGGSRMHV